MTDKIITFQITDVTKGKADVLLIPQFSDDKDISKSLPKFDQKVINGISKRSKKIGFKSEVGESFVVHSIDDVTHYDAVLVFGLDKKNKLKEDIFRETLAKALREVTSLKFETVAIYIPSNLPLSAYVIGKSISEALYLSQYHFNTYKSEENIKKQTKITAVTVCGDKKLQKEFDKAVEFGRIVSKATNFARDLVNEPGQYMYPEILAKHAENVAKSSKGAISIKVLDENECQKLGMGAFLAVSQGSEYKPRFVVLTYINKTAKKNSPSLCLIGKSITFDTGGLSLKPSKHMETMKLDMAGGASVLGAFSVLAEGAVDTSHYSTIYGILPICENALSGKSIRPGDIVYALNGTSVEILNTDAEGRMALADALSYAEKYLKPDYIIDVATLTGAIMVALGPDMTGLFSNNSKLQSVIEKAAKEEGEALWPMPMYKPYAKKMKSDVADLKNTTGMGGYGGAVTAALFLQEFVKKTKWAHLDIAGVSFNEGGVDGTTPKGGTGWGVRTLVNLLQTGIQ